MGSRMPTSGFEPRLVRCKVDTAALETLYEDREADQLMDAEEVALMERQGFDPFKRKAMMRIQCQNRLEP